MDIDQILTIIPRRIQEWTQKDVEVWLTFIQLPQLIPNFKHHRIDGRKLLKVGHLQLSKEFKIESNIIKKKICNWVQYLTGVQEYCHRYVSKLHMEKTPQPVKKSQKIQYILASAATCDEDSQSQTNSQGTNLTTEIHGNDSNTAKYSYIPDHETLYIYERCFNENKFFVCDQTSITFGRSHQNSFFVVDNDVQANHCTIIHRGNHHYLISSPKNSGAWVKIQKKMKLSQRCVIEMGQIDFHIAVNENLLTIIILALGSQPEKHVFNGFEKSSIRVGRRNNADIVKPHDTTLSGYHGKFFFDDDQQWIFEDLQTTNGSWLKCMQETLVMDKMIFRIGKSNYVYESRIWANEECKSVSSTSSELGTCRNCRNCEKNCYFKPCHHNQYCYTCAVFMNVCPVCNTKIKKREKIYKV